MSNGYINEKLKIKNEAFVVVALATQKALVCSKY